MRNLFDQYSQPENRLTHSLASALHQDKKLLQSFLRRFGPRDAPRASKLSVIEQSLPEKPEPIDGESFSAGLPDAMIFDESGWAFVIESKVNDRLTKNQLERHRATVKRCGFDKIHGLAITVREPRLKLDGWKLIRWRDVYSWGNSQRTTSPWAKFMVEYFNVAETRMASDEYLKEGTITEFSGVEFDPYTYLEGKRVLRLLARKIRGDRSFINHMRLDAKIERKAITDSPRLWDFIPFRPTNGDKRSFERYPHCTIGIGSADAQAMITFPSSMDKSLRNRLHADSYDDFADKLDAAASAMRKALRGVKAYRPLVRMVQRRYPGRRSLPIADGTIDFDLRAISGDDHPPFGPRIKRQSQWAQAAYELLANKRSNIQFQIGVEFFYPKFNELANKDADRYFVAGFEALRPFAGTVID